LDEMIRQQRYKDLADEALDILSRLHFDNHKVQYLTAQSHYNKWDYTSALYHIGKALEVLPENSPVRSNYLRFRYEAQDKQQKYAWQQ
ncbi:MAG: hypothetical protein KDE53_40060, partial [Caldilineaceae bacterium]|nr:hypothetical protein [Caldilineaceae bacterium]